MQSHSWKCGRLKAKISICKSEENNNEKKTKNKRQNPNTNIVSLSPFCNWNNHVLPFLSVSKCIRVLFFFTRLYVAFICMFLKMEWTISVSKWFSRHKQIDKPYQKWYSIFRVYVWLQNTCKCNVNVQQIVNICNLWHSEQQE